MQYVWVKRRDPGVRGSVLSLQKCRNGSRPRIQGTSERGLPQAQLVGKHQQQYLQPNLYGHKNGSNSCTIRWALD